MIASVDAVGFGKPYIYGLGAGGSEGVIKALEILRVELDRAMGLLGAFSDLFIYFENRPFLS